MRKSLTSGRFPFCQATVICVECRPLSRKPPLITPSATPRCRTAIRPRRRNLMTQKHKRPVAPASKKLAKKAGKPTVAAHSSKEKGAHAAKTAAKHAEVKKPPAKVKAAEKAPAAPANDAKGKVIELKAAQKLAAARAAANAAAAPDGKVKGRKGSAELINLPARRNVLPEERQSQLKLLIARGKEQGLPHVFAGERSPAVGDRRSRADRRDRQHDQRHGHPGVREGTGQREHSRARNFRSPPTKKPSRKPPQRWPRSMPNSAAPPTRCACTCAKWARWNC